MKKRLAAWLLMVEALGISGVAQCEDKTTVTVSFELAQPSYRREYQSKPGEVESLQQEVASVIARNLQEKIKLVRFSSTERSDYAIAFRLNDIEDAGKPGETVFHIALSGPGGEGKKIYWKFRPATKFEDPVQPRAAFVREIDLSLGKSKLYHSLVQDAFSQVPLAKSSIPSRNPLGFLLPYKRTDLCVDMQTTVLIDSMVPVSNTQQLNRRWTGQVVADFTPADRAMSQHRGKMLAELKPGQTYLEDLRRADPDKVQVRGVYIIEYVDLSPCTVPVTPEEARFK